MNDRKLVIHIGDFRFTSFTRPAAAVQEKPFEFKLIGNYPNPYNPSTKIQFSLPAEGFAELVIYNSTGQKIREIVSRTLPAEMYSVVWDGCDDRGKTVSSGVYISRLTMKDKATANRMLLVK